MTASNGVLQGRQKRPRIAAGSGHSSKLVQPEKSKESAGFRLRDEQAAVLVADVNEGRTNER